MRNARKWSETPQGQAAEMAALCCAFDDAAKVIEDAIVRTEGNGRIGTRARRILSEQYRRLATCRLGAREFDNALLYAQRSYDLAEAADGPLSPAAVPALALRSELALIRGATAESKSTAERAYAVALEQRSGPAASAPAFLQGAVLAYLAGKLPEARAAALEAARLSEDLLGTDSATGVGAKILLARIKWSSKLRDEAVSELAAASEQAAGGYYAEIQLASAEMALTRHQPGAAAMLLWAPAAMRLTTGEKLGSAARETVDRALRMQPESPARATDTRFGELMDLLAYFDAGLLSS